MTLAEKIRACIREVPDFPIPGVLFKDISPLFLDPALMREIRAGLVSRWAGQGITKVVGIDSRGFLFGPQIAMELDAGFVLARKKGKLPPETVQVSYALEYGSATLESVKGNIVPGDRVIIHDDLLATGGTAEAAARLAEKFGAQVEGFSFLISLAYLNGEQRLMDVSTNIHYLIGYDK